MVQQQSKAPVFGSMEAISKGNPDGLPMKTYMPKKTTSPVVKKTYMPKLKNVKNHTRAGGKKVMPSQAAVAKSVKKTMGY